MILLRYPELLYNNINAFHINCDYIMLTSLMLKLKINYSQIVMRTVTPKYLILFACLA